MNTGKHHKPNQTIPRVEHYMHLVYFALVAISGPYNYAAGVCFVIGLVVVLIREE